MTLRDAAAGGAATVPMSALMLAAEKIGIMGEQPPRAILESSLSAVGLDAPEEAARKPLIAAAHVGYGMLAGALFGVLYRRLKLPLPATVQGIGYGLLVWVLSYEGWVPALGLMPEPEHDRPGRPGAMIAAHVVYGAALGSLAGRAGRPVSPCSSS